MDIIFRREVIHPLLRRVQATTPIVAAVNALQGDVNGIKCKLPETVTLPYSCATAVPTQAVFNGYALGAYAGWNNGYCGNSLWG